jgi:hypothetical protein
MVEWIIYAIIDPYTQRVRYVGKTQHGMRVRIAQHMHQAMTRKTGKDKWLYGFIKDGIMPRVRVLESGVGDEWPEAESRWIAHFQALHEPLLNSTHGGDGVLHISENDGRLRANRLKSGKRRQPATDETKRKIGAATRRRYASMSPEERTASGRQFTAEDRRKGLAARWPNSQVCRRAESSARNSLTEPPAPSDDGFREQDSQ